MKEKKIILKDENGTGKTMIAKAIANLIPYDGTILSPLTIYLSLDSSIIEKQNLSKGEKAIYLIELALTKEYELFILDEILDVISKKNLDKIIRKLENKQLFIITHKEMNLDYKKYSIKDFIK